MSNKALVPLGLIAAAGVMGSMIPGGQAARRKYANKRVERADWFNTFDRLVGHPQPPPQDYWDTAQYLYLSGLSAEEAAKKYRSALGL